MAVSESLVRELRERVDCTADTLRDALKATKGNVEKAVVHLIDELFYVEGNALNAKLVPEKLFVRAKRNLLKYELREVRMSLTFAKGTSSETPLRRTLARTEREFKDPKTYRGLRERVAKTQRNFTPEAIEASVGKVKKKAGPAVVKMPPLPTLKYDFGEWVGKDTIEAWAGFCAGGGRASSGKLAVVVTRETDDDDPQPPAAEQVAAYAHFKDNAQKIRDAVLKAVFAEFTKLRRRGRFDDLDEDDPASAAALAKVKTAAELKRHLDAPSVRVMEHAKAGQAYVGLSFGCTWDEEHGLGVLLHKSRVLKVDDAEVPFNEHGAKRDGGKRIK